MKRNPCAPHRPFASKWSFNQYIFVILSLVDNKIKNTPQIRVYTFRCVFFFYVSIPNNTWANKFISFRTLINSIQSNWIWLFFRTSNQPFNNNNHHQYDKRLIGIYSHTNVGQPHGFTLKIIQFILDFILLQCGHRKWNIKFSKKSAPELSIFKPKEEEEKNMIPDFQLLISAN